ncbi:MAG: aspartate/glutamate racemase family protein [Solirubrobacterales bacterium]
MRIGVVHVNTEEASGPYTELITANLERAKRDDTEIEHRYVRHLRRATDTAIGYPTLLNKVDVVNEMLELERGGADAVLVACSGDPGVSEARSLLHVPVVGPMEAAMGLVLGYGWRFGIVTVADPTWSAHMDQVVHNHGLTARYAGQRVLETPTAKIFTEGFERPEIVRDDIAARSREMVEAGAEAILIGSAGLSTFASHFGIAGIEEPATPIFDVISTGFKVAELRAELKAKLGVPEVGRGGWYSEFDERNRQRVHRLFGWVDEPAVADN